MCEETKLKLPIHKIHSIERIEEKTDGIMCDYEDDLGNHYIAKSQEEIYCVTCDCEDDLGVNKNHCLFLTASELEFAEQHKYIYIYV